MVVDSSCVLVACDQLATLSSFAELRLTSYQVGTLFARQFGADYTISLAMAGHVVDVSTLFVAKSISSLIKD